ncbi:MAG TPA: hypothetical protein VNH11_24710 [Pirellulales bacterium]|nr:hypothetical protein [Pirellulales bacterium]
MNTIWTLLRAATHYVTHFGPFGWLGCFLLTLAVGVVCLRGFGSRSNY